jgi:hypothetical protein
MSATSLLLLQCVPLICLALVLFYFGMQAQKAQREIIDRIKARYPKWIITFNSDGSTTTHQVNSKEEHEALEATLKKS